MAPGRRPSRTLLLGLCLSFLAVAQAAAAADEDGGEPAGNNNTGGSLADVEHIVVFMQENRAFDHYYGSLRGVRGFHDRAAPLLPSGLSPFYQPVVPPAPHSVLCGCVAPAGSAQGTPSCNVSFTRAGADLRGILLGAKCADLADVLGGAVPPVSVQPGEPCATLLDAVYATRVEGLVVKEYMSAPPTCPKGLVVDELAEKNNHDNSNNKAGGDPTKDYLLPFPLMFDNTSASCMGAPEMAYACNMNMLNGGLVDGTSWRWTTSLKH